MIEGQQDGIMRSLATNTQCRHSPRGGTNEFVQNGPNCCCARNDHQRRGRGAEIGRGRTRAGPCRERGSSRGACRRPECWDTGGTTSATPAATKSAINTALSNIATFIPAEALALYLALLGLCIGTSEDRQYGLKWFLLAMGLVAVVVSVLDGLFAARKVYKEDQTKPPADQTIPAPR